MLYDSFIIIQCIRRFIAARRWACYYAIIGEKVEKKSLIIQYRGKCTEDYARALHKIEAPCTIIMTLRKLKTVLPSLKTPVEKMLRSGVVYKRKCPRCFACYVGQTSRHLQSRFREHLNNQGPMKSHLSQCHVSMQRTFKQPGTNEISSITVPCDYEGRGYGDPSINIERRCISFNTRGTSYSRAETHNQYERRIPEQDPDNQVVVSCLTSEHLSLWLF